MTTTLADLHIHEKGIIDAVKCQGEVRRRLLDMGVVKGAEFELIRKAPLGDPLEIKINGFHLSLRISEARTLFVIPATALAPVS